MKVVIYAKKANIPKINGKYSFILLNIKMSNTIYRDVLPLTPSIIFGNIAWFLTKIGIT